MTTIQSLARLGSVSAFAGAIVLFASTLLHPMSRDPNNAPEAFAEYAADSFYVWTHLGQFAGFALLGAALVALAATFEPGRASSWARIGLATTIVGIATAAALQAVDGVALKVTVDRWASATGDTRAVIYEAALAVREIEIGLASLLSITTGLTLIAFGLAMLLGVRYPRWLGAIGLLDGVGMVAAGAAQAATGFSALAMALSMAASSVLLIWIILAGIFMWRLAPLLESKTKDGAFNRSSS
jgi:hypothetical protein